MPTGLRSLLHSAVYLITDSGYASGQAGRRSLYSAGRQ